MIYDDVSKFSACVIGCGGLGGYVIEALVRSGIKKLVLFDDDVFEKSNLNRQLLCCYDSLGKSKVLAYRERVEKVSNCTVEAINERFEQSNASAIDFVDIVVDCTDNIQSRLLIAKECKKRDKMLVHGAVEGVEGQVALCSPKKDTIERLYKNIADEKHNTNAITVMMTASIQATVALKTLLGEASQFVDKLILIDSTAPSIVHLDF